MNNKDYYDKAYAATQNADGAMDQMQEDYMQGIEAQLQKVATNIETLFTQIYNSGVVEDLVGAFSSFTDVLSDLFDNIEGGVPIISGLVAVLMKLGGKQIAQGVSNQVANHQARKMEQQNANWQKENAKKELMGQG